MPALETLLQNEYFIALLILLVSVTIVKIFHFVSENYLKKLVAKTKSDIDDAILEGIFKPVVVSINF